MAEFKEAFENTLGFEDAGLSGRVTCDAGGRTRFGIAEKFHAELPEDFFTGPAEAALREAEAIEERDYWTSLRLGEISSQPVANKLFDMAVNMGVRQAAVLAQRGVNAVGARATSGAWPAPAASSGSSPDIENSALTAESGGATRASLTAEGGCATRENPSRLTAGGGSATRASVVTPALSGPESRIAEDGVIGAITLAAINRLDPGEYLEMLRELSADFYRHVASLHPAEAVDLAGWLRRARA